MAYAENRILAQMDTAGDVVTNMDVSVLQVVATGATPAATLRDEHDNDVVITLNADGDVYTVPVHARYKYLELQATTNAVVLLWHAARGDR